MTHVIQDHCPGVRNILVRVDPREVFSKEGAYQRDKHLAQNVRSSPTSAGRDLGFCPDTWCV